MNENKIDELMDELDADTYHRGEDWHGYTVYIPDYDGDPIIGLPYVVLEKDGEARICTGDEALRYLNDTEDGSDDEDDIKHHAVFGGKKDDSPSPDWLS